MSARLMKILAIPKAIMAIALYLFTNVIDFHFF